MNNFKNIKQMIVALVVTIIFATVMVAIIVVDSKIDNVLICSLGILTSVMAFTAIMTMAVSELNFRKIIGDFDPQFKGATDIKISLDGKSISFTKEIGESDIPSGLLKL